MGLNSRPLAFRRPSAPSERVIRLRLLDEYVVFLSVSSDCVLSVVFSESRERFLTTNSEWLEENVSLPDIVTEVSLPGTCSGSAVIPHNHFESSSIKTKRRPIQQLLEKSSQEELSMATEVQLRKSGKRDSAAIVKELCVYSPRRCTNLKKAQKCLETSKPVGLSEDYSLALIVVANLSTNQSYVIRQ
ncbi:hypothetical protein PR048_024711 [Dryococelus australis]|uniref:Uncharacterized protein n=1 Tax=Dryococelus australis TaxID=614101 RepID=A0ABQ9GPB9_9NEOP|nr:hypothetical protein PR048_024711 [Dryococelus australis]